MQRADPRTVRALRAVRLGAPSAQSRRCPGTDRPAVAWKLRRGAMLRRP